MFKINYLSLFLFILLKTIYKKKKKKNGEKEFVDNIYFWVSKDLWDLRFFEFSEMLY